MQKDQLKSLFEAQIGIILDEFDNSIKLSKSKGYRRHRFLECLSKLVLVDLEQGGTLESAAVLALDLVLEMKPNQHSDKYDQKEANRYLREDILKKYKDDFTKVAAQVSSRLLEQEFHHIITPFTDNSSGSNCYGIRLEPIQPFNVNEDKAESSQAEKSSSLLSMAELPGNEIVHYEEIELPKSVWPRRIRSTRLKLEFAATLFFFVALISIIFFLICSLQEKPNLLLVGLSGLTMYFFIAVMFFTARAAYYREFSAPVFMWRRAANIPAVIVTPEKVGGREKTRLIEVKNIIGRCPVCLSNGYPEDEAVVYLKPKFGSIKGRLEGVCSISDRHIYDYDSVTNKGCRQKVS